MKLSNQAADVLNDMLVEYFTLIASQAVTIIKRAEQEEMSSDEVRKVIRQVMAENFP